MRFLLQPEQQANEIRRGKPASLSPSPNEPGFSQDLQGHVGNQAIQSLFRSGAVQASLAIGTVDDPAEHEANEIAARIMGVPANSRAFRQRSSYQDHAPASVPGAVEQVVHSQGSPLDPATRSFFESRFSRNLSHVRVHTGAEAAASARSINALSYTAGSDIVFAHGRYSPHTDEGKHLLAHELVHTTQQARGSSRVQRSPDLGAITVNVTHFNTNIPFSGIQVHIEQKLVSSTNFVDLVTDSDGNTDTVNMEEGDYTVTITYKCCSQKQDTHITANQSGIVFMTMGICKCPIASADQDSDSSTAA